MISPVFSARRRIFYSISIFIQIIVLVAFGYAGYRIYFTDSKNQAEPSGQKYDIIYFGNPAYENWTEGEARNQCESQGGAFNPCGSACLDPSQPCIQVCAMRCEFSKSSGRSAIEDFEKNIEKSTIDTSDWKTYRNEKYGFEVRYPATFTIWNAEGGSKNFNINGQERVIAFSEKNIADSPPRYGQIDIVIWEGRAPFEVDLAAGLLRTSKQEEPLIISAHTPITIDGRIATNFHLLDARFCEKNAISLIDRGINYWFFGGCVNNKSQIEEFQDIVVTFKFFK